MWGCSQSHKDVPRKGGEGCPQRNLLIARYLMAAQKFLQRHSKFGTRIHQTLSVDRYSEKYVAVLHSTLLILPHVSLWHSLN